MNIHTRLVGAFDAIILSSAAAVNVVMLLALLDPSFGSSPFQMLNKRATVTIEQIAVDDTVAVRHL